jgi:hypothetical protein
VRNAIFPTGRKRIVSFHDRRPESPDRRRYGVFGGRIVELLEDDSRLTLFVGGRSVARANAFVRSRGNTGAQLTAIAFDRDGDVAGQLSAIGPDIVVDASGPFQAYGDDRYRVVQACLTRGLNYLDLADGSDFVAGIGAYDDQAKAAGVYVLAGVSSFPVLTAAAVRRLSAGMTAIKVIIGGIAPSPYAGVGENVIRAIAGYAGRPIRRKRDGVFCTGYPLTEQLRYTIAPPGQIPLYNKMFSLVDVPDLRALAALWPEAGKIWMGAAPVPELLHRFLITLAWCVRLRLWPSLSPLAPLMHFATNHIRWGEHRGGMFVEVCGMDASGVHLKRAWHLLADGDDGPLIPAMAVEAIVRHALQGRPPPPGARAAVCELELDDYAKLFARRAIFTGIRPGPVSDSAPPMRASSAKRGAISPPKFAPCTIFAGRPSRKVARALSGDPACWRASSPRSSAFQQQIPTSPFVCSLTRRTGLRFGPENSATTASLAVSSPVAVSPSTCCVSASVR